MSRRAATLGLVLGAALTAGAGEAGAPLENSSQELKELQRGQAAQNSGVTAGRLGESLPQIQTPKPGAPPLERPKRARTKMEEELLKKKEATQKNWLVEGMDQLDKNSKTKDRTAGEAKAEAFTDPESEKPDSSDPNYMLKLYSEQQKAAGAKAGAKHSGLGQGDPFAPFLQGWLGSSPVRGKFFDEFARKPDGHMPVVAPAGSPVGGIGQNFSNVDAASSSRGGGAAVAQPNPYLQGLDLTPLQDLGGSRNQTAAGLEIFSKPAGGPSAALPSDPVPSPRQADKKPLRPSLSDDKKYFPQLKKF